MSTPKAPKPRNSSVAKAAKAGQGSKNLWVIIGVAAVVIFAGIIAVALSQEESSKVPEVAAVSVEGTPLPIQDAEASVGVTIPTVSGTGLDGEAMTISNDGRAKLIGFFAHWCPHCRNEVPVVRAWVEGGNVPEDVDVMAVSTSITPGQPNYPPSKWFERENWNIPTLKDDATSTAHIAFGGGNFPYWVAVDAEGQVVQVTSGELTQDQLNQMMLLVQAGAVVDADEAEVDE